MKSFEEFVSEYGKYHQNPKNRMTHFIGVPLVVLSLQIAAGWFRFSPTLSMAHLCTLALLLFYFRLSWKPALVVTPFLVVSLLIANALSQLPGWRSFIWFLVVTTVAWSIQLLGHRFEGNRPALVDNLFQALAAPLFLASEVLGSRLK